MEILNSNSPFIREFGLDDVQEFVGLVNQFRPMSLHDAEIIVSYLSGQEQHFEAAIDLCRIAGLLVFLCIDIEALQ